MITDTDLKTAMFFIIVNWFIVFFFKSKFTLLLQTLYDHHSTDITVQEMNGLWAVISREQHVTASATNWTRTIHSNQKKTDSVSAETAMVSIYFIFIAAVA